MDFGQPNVPENGQWPAAVSSTARGANGILCPPRYDFV